MLKKTTIYFDGACHLCSREMQNYRIREGSQNLHFVDIAASDFDANTVGLDPKKVQAVLHVQRRDRTYVTGIDAFAAIWRELRIFPILIFLVEHQPSRLLFAIGYRAFAAIRPLLPKRKRCSLSRKSCSFNKFHRF
ncbi:MAG: DUF393 domain-containing protein [Myxococcaceae bacterium]